MLRPFILLLLALTCAYSQDVRITEFLPHNTSGIQDEDGTYQPWIELWNPNPTSTVTLTNWRLSHSGTQWTFPPGFQIPPGEFVVVFASGKNRQVVTKPAHTNFTLNPAGSGPLQLLRSDSSVASTFTTYPALGPNESYGRDLLDNSQIGRYTNPTPEEENNFSGPEVASDVVVSVPSRAFQGTLSVSLTQEIPAEGAVIRYTTNGTPPISSSTLYSGNPLNISSTAQLRARVFEPGKLPGAISTAGYLLLDASTANFNTAAPIVVVSNFGLGTFPDTGDQSSFMWVWEPGPDGRARLSNAPTLATRTAVDRRGSSTIGNPKTNFNLEARKSENDFDREIELLGMPDGSDWVFHAPYNFDRSLLHNPFIFALSNNIGRTAMRNRMAEVFVETTGGALTFSGGLSGDYYGLYNVMEKIRRGNDRVEITKLGMYDNDVIGKTGGYITKIDRRDAGDTGFDAGGLTSGTLGLCYYYPKEIEIKASQRDPQEQYLTQYYNSTKAALDSPNFKDPVTGYAAWIDVPAAVDHHLLNVWAFNVDAFRLSGFMTKQRNGKLEFGPIWDFDRALSSTDGRDANPATWRSQTGDLGTDFFNFTWWNRLFNDIDFYQKYIDRWGELRRGEFAPEKVNALLDSLNAELTTEGVNRDLARWNQTKRSWLSPFPPNTNYPASQAAEVQRIKDWLQQRANFMNSQWVAPVTLNHDGGSVEAGFAVTMTAAAGSTIYYTLDGSDPRPSGGLAPTSASVLTYTGPIVVNNPTRIKARAYNASWAALTGPNNPPLVSKWSSLRDARYTNDPAASAGTLAVTEVNYHPADPTPAELAVNPAFDTSDFEFVELKNIGTTTIDLGGVELSNGARFLFDNDVAITLDPGEFAILAANPAAFAARYGSVPNVLGPFSGDLSNGGEQLLVKALGGSTLVSLTYDDAWYPNSDGGGRTLELLSSPPPDYNVASSWRGSLREGGTPGFDYKLTISQQPTGSTVDPGQPINLSVQVSADPAPTYQWRKNGDPIAGATSASFAVASATEADQGNYDVLITNIGGTLPSNVAVVAVNDPVAIVTHPTPHTVNPSAVVVFSVDVTGTEPITFQWRKGGVPIEGEVGQDLAVVATEAAEGAYDVVVANHLGPITSNPAQLSVNDPVVITGNPMLQDVNPGQTATFSVTATGTGPLAYQWRKNTVPIEGAINSMLSFAVAEGDEGNYDVVVTNMVNSVISQPAQLIVGDPVVITGQPSAQPVNPGTPITLTVVVTGAGPLSYQWRKGGQPIVGANSAEYAIGSAAESDQGEYDVVVSNAFSSQTSAVAQVSVNDPVTITVQPKSQGIAPGGSVTFSVVAIGTGDLTYQWRKDNVAIDGAIGASYEISAAAQTNLGNYDVVITNVVGSVTSEAAALSFVDWTAVAGTYQGIVEGPDLSNPEADPYPGRVTATVSKTAKVSGKLEFFGMKHSFSAKFDANLVGTATIIRKDTTPVTVTVHLDSINKALEISTSHSDGDGQFETSGVAPQIPKRSKSSPAQRAGRYTLLLSPGAGAPEVPMAPGFLTLNVATSGKATWIGKLPDLTVLKGSASLTSDDELAVYAGLYVRKFPTAGYVGGTLALTATEVSGDFGWRKPSQIKGLYWRTGLAVLLSANGGRYVPPAKSTRVIPSQNLTLELGGPITLETTLTLDLQNKFVFPDTPQKWKLKLNKTTGGVTGSYFDAANRATRKLEGVLLQAEEQAAGFFPGASSVVYWDLLPVEPPQ